MEGGRERCQGGAWLPCWIDSGSTRWVQKLIRTIIEHCTAHAMPDLWTACLITGIAVLVIPGCLCSVAPGYGNTHLAPGRDRLAISQVLDMTGFYALYGASLPLGNGMQMRCQDPSKASGNAHVGRPHNCLSAQEP